MPSSPSTETLADAIKAQARTLGFDLVGITALGPAETAPYFDSWCEAGYAGDMAYLPRGAEKRADTRLPFPGTSTAIVVGLNYGGTQQPGPIAKYARGNDYHDVMVDKLNSLHEWIERAVDHSIRGKAYVDTGPILERDLARRAGLGWFGKNTTLIHPRLGSFFFIGSLLLDLELPVDPPFTTQQCGTCTRCLDACPTDALVAPHRMDATRCISYLTIELKGSLPTSLRTQIGELAYGCDICQDVCPYNNKFSKPLTELALAPKPELESATLVELMQLSEDDWRRIAKGSPIKRTKRRGFLRNVAVALGNSGDSDAIPALINALSDIEPLVRSHAAWALGQIGTAEAFNALSARVSVEDDTSVAEEIRSALTTFDGEP